MSLKQVLLLGCLLVFIAPSFQYGTIFTDNVQPAFSDRTYFSGIKSEEVLTTDASIGVIGSDNLAGFSVNTPGTISSTADTHSFTSSQIIEFTASEVLNVLSAGSLSVASHRTDVDADSFSFAGEGDASLNGLSSTIRANYFQLNTTGNAAIRSTGDELDFTAPVFVGFAAVDNATVTANNNVVLESDASFIDYSGQYVLLTSNYFSANGDLYSSISTNQFTMEAKAIVDLSSLTELHASAFTMDLTVDSGDINIHAPSRFTIEGIDSTVDDTYAFTFQSSSNLHLDSKGSTASNIQFEQTGEVQLVADNAITFATFFGESGFTFDSDIDLTYTSTDISNTVVRAQYIAADSLVGTASSTVYISVPSEDLFVKTAVGDISFASNRNDVTLNTQDDLVASAVHTYIDTLDDIYIDSASTLFQQNNPDSETGILRVDVQTQTVLNGTVFEITSAGTNEFTAGALYYATGFNVEVIGNKAVDNIVFSTNRQTSIAAIDTLTYKGEHITISAITFNSEIDNNYDIATFDLEANAEDVTIDAATLTVHSVRDAVVFNTQSVATLNAQSLHHVGYNIEFINPAFDINAIGPVIFNADSNFSWNSANDVSITSPTFTLSSVQSSQFLSNTFSESAPTVTITGKTIYQSQNLPSDELEYVTSSLTISGDFVDIISGGDVLIENDQFTTTGLGPYTIDASASVHYDIDDDLFVLTNAASTFRSAGELNFQITGPINFDNDNDIYIFGPEGENAFVSFHTGDITYGVDFMSLSATDFLVSAGSFDWNESNNFSLTGVNQWGDLFINSEDGAVTIDAADDLYIHSDAVLVYHAEDLLDVQAGDAMVFNTFIYDVIAPSHTVEAGSFNLLGTVGQVSSFVFDGTTFESTIALRTDIEAANSASFYSGNTLDFTIDQNILITSQTLIIDGFTLVEFFSTDLVIDTQFTPLNIISGGESNYVIAGNLYQDSFGNFASETFTARATVGEDTSFTAEAGPITDTAKDGVIHYIAFSQSVESEVENVYYTSSGNVEINSQTTFTAEGSFPLTTDAITLETTEIDGNIVFQTEVGDISITAQDDQEIISNGFGSVTAALGITYDVTGTLDGSAGENIDVKSFAHTTFRTTTFATYLIGDSATFEAGRNIRFTSDERTDLSSVTEFTVSTGEQGDLNIYSAGKLTFSTTGNQDYHSSGDYSWAATDDLSNEATKDIDLHTTGGPILFETKTGDITYTIGNNFNWRSGEDLYYDVDGDYSLSSDSNVQSLAEKGDITIDASGDLSFHAVSGDITLLSLGNRNKNVPFEDIIDGITLNSFDTSFTFSSSFGFFPGNVLHFGGETQPDLNIAAAGSTATTGFTLDSDGHVSMTSTETTEFTQVNLFINSREYVHFSADEVLSLTAINTLSAKADAGHVRFYSAADFTETAELSITDTATGGYFLFTNNNKEITSTTELGFKSSNNNVVMSGNLLTEDIDESFHGTIGDIIFTITNAASFTTTEGDNGSLQFSSTTGALSMSAKGSITGQVTGPGGAFRVDAGSMAVTTLKSSDITLHTAGRFESYIKTTATYTTTTGAVAIESLSVDGADYTQGDIHIKSTSGTTGDIRLVSADTTDITADGNIYLNSTSTTLTAIDILYESFDDTILFGESYTGTTALLFMGNTDGNGGNINMLTGSYYQTGSILWDITDDVNAKFAGNVIGFSEDTASFTASSASNTDSSFSLITTLQDADIYFTTEDIGGVLNVNINQDVEFDTTDTIKTVSGLFSEYISNTGIDFTSTGGNFLFNTTRSGIKATVGNLADFHADTSIITIESNGISPDSNYGVRIYGTLDAGRTGNTVLLSAAKQLSLFAYEAVEFRTDDRTVLGSPTYLPITQVTVPSTTKTTFITTGLETNILFNTRVPEDGIVGSLSIVATPIIDVITCTPSLGDSTFSFPVFGDSGAVDLVASETIRFEQVSGISFEGRFGDFLEDTTIFSSSDCNTAYGTALNTDPSDAFFYAQGDYAGIEISTSGGFSDIEFYLDTIAVFDADQELILGSTGETTSFVELHSINGAVNFQVLSTNASDAIEVHAYNGRIYMDANNYGNILFVPQNNIYFTAVRGIELESNTVNAAAQNIQFLSRSGHIHVAADNIFTTSNLLTIGVPATGFTSNDVYSNVFISATTSSINTVNAPIQIVTNGGDIRFDFGRDADFSDVTNVVFNHPTSLRLPMKQESITPGTECQIPSQVAIAHNNFYSDGFGQLEGTKDTGIMICWCSTSESRWYCRTLSPALPYN